MAVHLEKRRIPILMYHSISEQARPKFRPFTVAPALFAEQIRYLYQHDYSPMTVSQLVEAYNQNEDMLPARPVVITFDDAFLDFYTAALPILKLYSFPATLYIPTAYVNKTSRWMEQTGEGDRTILSWDQLREISQAGIECGAHSHSHPQMDLLTLAQARKEIIQSKLILEEHLGEEICSFAYPYGYHTSAIKLAVRDAGYTSACAVKNALSTEMTDHFALTRVLVGPDADIPSFAALLEGHDRRIATATYTRPLVPAWRLVRFCSALMQKPQNRNREMAQL